MLVFQFFSFSVDQFARRSYVLRFTFYVLSATLILSATAVLAQDRPISDDEVNAVAKQLYCPTCESVPVDVCPTQACSDWRALIREQLEEGRSEQEILDYFAERFGSQALVNPPRQGIGIIVWIGPLVLVLLGVLLFGRYFYGLGTQAPASDSEPAAAEPLAQDKYRAQLEQELEQKADRLRD